MKNAYLEIEQYFQVQDYALWDVIKNGNAFIPVTQTTTLEGETRFGGNEATKKTQKTILKQMYENFSAPSTESLDSIFNTLHKIVSHVAVLGEFISQKDLSLKFLRSLSFEWNTHVVVWRNKPDLDIMSIGRASGMSTLFQCSGVPDRASGMSTLIQCSDRAFGMSTLIQCSGVPGRASGRCKPKLGGGPRRRVQPTRVCSYTDFKKCQPLNFKGTEGVVCLSQWLEKMELVFHISGCAVDNQGTIKKKLTDKYCSKGEIKKLEIELWNLKETEKVDKYISVLPDNIHGNVMSARPKTLDEAIELANDLMDKKLHTYAERQTESKRKFDNNNQAQHIPKRQNGHYKSDCLELKNQKHGNQAKGTGARRMVYALGGEETNQHLDDIEDDINT
nr:hypothetical protein [Tanacetum cinerariifolium]